MSYPPPPPPPVHGGAQGGYGAPRKSSTMALLSMVAGIISVPACGCFVFSVTAIVLGVLGRKEIAESGGRLTGDGMAKAGVILGIVTLALAVVLNALALAGVVPFYDFDFSNRS